MAKVMVVDDAYSALERSERNVRPAPPSTSPGSAARGVFVRLIVSLTAYGAGLQHREARA